MPRHKEIEPIERKYRTNTQLRERVGASGTVSLRMDCRYEIHRACHSQEGQHHE